MFDNFFERRTARKNDRFRVFVEAKSAYRAFIQEMNTCVNEIEMSEEHYLRSREDPRLKAAKEGFSKAIEMSEKDGALDDAAIARCELGKVLYAIGELDEAAKLIHYALGFLSSLPNHNRTADISICHYYLGIIALKNGHLIDSVQELQLSRQIDEANGDFSGMQICDLALAACAQAGADLEGSTLISSDSISNWDAQEDIEEIDVERTMPSESENNLGTVRYEQREMIWLASFSVQANNELMMNLNLLGKEFGRPICVSCVAFGSIDPERCNVRQPEPDQHLCAAILVIEKAGLNNQAFQEFTFKCIQRVITFPDFRLLVYLHDLNRDEFLELKEKYLFIKELFDTTQIAESPSFEQLRHTLVPYVRNVERIRAAAQWRDFRLKLAVICGSLSTTILFIATSLPFLGFSAWLLKLDLLSQYGPQISSLVLGMLLFPVNTPLIFLFLRGMRTTALAPIGNVSLMRWINMGFWITAVANLFWYFMGGPFSWILLGLFTGVLLDSIRRSGKQAQRQLIDIEALKENANSPELLDPKQTVLRGDAINPFSCPILPAFSARIFISYTQNSKEGSKRASSLYQGLKKVGASPFIDWACIQTGASWRRALNHNLGECDVFLCLLDDESAERQWVAAELLAAIESRRLTGSPEIVILIDPKIKRDSKRVLPIFHGVLSVDNEPYISGRPQIRQINEYTRSALLWGLSPREFTPISIFTHLVAIPIVKAMNFLGLIGTLGLFAGLILGLLTMMEKIAGFPFASLLAEWNLMEFLTLLTAFWLGYTARVTIAWRYELDNGRDIGTSLPTIATLGLVYALLLFVPKVSFFILSWTVVIAIAGWMTVATAFRLVGTERRTKIM